VAYPGLQLTLQWLITKPGQCYLESSALNTVLALGYAAICASCQLGNKPTGQLGNKKKTIGRLGYKISG